MGAIFFPVQICSWESLTREEIKVIFQQNSFSTASDSCPTEKKKKEEVFLDDLYKVFCVDSRVGNSLFGFCCESLVFFTKKRANCMLFLKERMGLVAFFKRAIRSHLFYITTKLKRVI